MMMKAKSKNLLRRLAVGSLAALVLAVTTPSFAIRCSHQTSRSQSEMLECMRRCNQLRFENGAGAATTIGKGPCMQVENSDSEAWTLATVRLPEWSGLNFASPEPVLVFDIASHVNRGVSERAPPGLHLSAGFPAVPTAHGPPLS